MFSTGTYKCLLLFALNWLDAQLTLVWLRAGLAEEANRLMLWLIEQSEATFLVVKICLGLSVALFLYRFIHLKTAQRGLTVALTVYSLLMLIHLATGLSAIESYVPADALLALIQHPRGVLLFAF